MTEPNYSRTFGADDAREIRNAVKRDLGKDAFRERPLRALWFIPMTAIIVGGIAAILTLGMPWWANLLVSLLVGHTVACQALLAHEVLHGALGLNRKMQNFLGWLGFGPALVPPEFWRRWHNIAHHANTNLHDKDPDSFGTMARYEKYPKMANFTKPAPGSGKWYSYLFLTYSFVFHAQLVLWMQTRRRKEFGELDRNKAIRQSLYCAAAWVALAIASGPLLIFTVVIPLAMLNIIGQSYILTNHMLRPQMDNNHPVDNSMSVRTWRWLDPLHFHFSHHVEHHMFPKMGSDQAPKVRAWLEREMPQRYVCPTHFKALKMLYTTPRVYSDAETLVDPLKPERRVNVHDLHKKAA
ncbi:fatty acid desaturase [gamma proteobacterium HTCC5015]|nr:fatty acid desaturase [gamma proteobacterium HTCC5015]